MLSSGRSSAVLVVSHDPVLRETYTILFEQAGYTAQAADLSHSLGRLKSTRFSALVIDHTLSKEERKSLVHVARQLAPHAKTVVFHRSAGDCGADLAMDSREGAVAILDRLKALVDRGGIPRA